MIGSSLIVIPLAGLIDVEKEIQRQIKNLIRWHRRKKGLIAGLTVPNLLKMHQKMLFYRQGAASKN